MRFERLQLTLWTTIMTLGLLVLGACAGAPAPAAESTGAEAAASGGAIATYSHPVSFPDLDPSSGFSNENVVIANVYETLTAYNPPGSAETLSPRLATAWESSDDATQWTFQLREGVTFHDGTPFNAEAVKFSLERTKEIGLGAAFILDPIEEIEVVDDTTVRFGLSYPAPLDLILSSGYGAWIMSPAVAERDNAWFNAGNDGGTGPYTISTYEPSQRLVIDAYDDHWGGWEEGQFEQVVFEIVEDSTVREQMIRAGDADFTYSLPYENYAALADVDGLVVDTTPSFQNLLGLLNNVKPPLDDARVRRALAHSFPYELVADNLYAGQGTVASGPVPAGMWGHDPDLPRTEFDLDKARALLEEAGIGEGELSLLFTYVSSNLDEQQVGELWRAELAKIGVDLELSGLAWEAQWDLGMGDPMEAQDVFAFYWWPTYVTPYDFLFSMFHSEDEPFFNLGYYNNADFDTLIDSGNEISGVDREQATQDFIEAQKMLIDEAAAIFILDLPDVHVVRDDISGYVNNPAYPHVVFWYDLRR